MNFREIELEKSYRTNTQFPPETLYRSVFPIAKGFRRAAGYFTSTVFNLFNEEIIKFVKNGGKIELICSPFLTEEDIEALSKGYSTEKIVHERINLEVDELLRRAKNHVEFLGTLIKLNLLSLKVAFCPKSGGMFHDKSGYFVDNNENIITFIGSGNESYMGWSSYGNYENHQVFRSWLSNDSDRVHDQKKYIDDLWIDKTSGLQVIDFPEVPRKKLISVAKNSLDEVSIDSSKEGGTKSERKLMDHQKEVIESWKDNNYLGIIKHATGSGKTVTALFAIRDHINEGKCALIIVPRKLLLEQWKEEVKKDIKGPTIILCGGGNSKWRTNNNVITATRNNTSEQGAIIIAVQNTASKIEFKKQIKSAERMLIVADEVHNLGSENFSEFFEIKFGKRLGLSATPERYGDPDGTKRIFDFFGDIRKPIFTLKDAIQCKRLVNYNFYPEHIFLTSEEEEKWNRITQQIIFKRSNEKNDKEGNITKEIMGLLIKRARVAKKAENKIQKVCEIIKKECKKGQHWLVYCEDGEQLNLINEELIKIGYNPFIYISAMEGNQESQLEAFKNMDGILLSIRCLDEGVDIPVISHAVIAASSRNPREYIQRRGRVLRKNTNKYNAVIYDLIVTPMIVGSNSLSGLMLREVQRGNEFAKDAFNKDESISRLNEILIKFGKSQDDLPEDDEYEDHIENISEEE